MTLVARHGALTDIGLHRKTNEDTFVVQPPLYAVCDGMGGASAGEVASGLAAETLAAEVAKGDAAARGRRGRQRRRLPARPRQRSSRPAWAPRSPPSCSRATRRTSCTSATAAPTCCATASCAQVSDDHSLVGEMVRDGRLTEEEAAVHPHRSILSRALGTEPQARIDEFTEDLLPGDVLLLCSDGLSGPVARRRHPRRAHAAATRRRPPSA